MWQEAVNLQEASAGGTLPQFLASNCISDSYQEHFLDSIFVFQKMVTANRSKSDTCQKLWQGVADGRGGAPEAGQGAGSGARRCKRSGAL